MQPYNPNLQVLMSSISKTDFNHELQISRTPQKKKLEQKQTSTAADIELTPLVSPARLGICFTSFIQIPRMEYINTPYCPKSNMMIPIFLENGHADRQTDYFSAPLYFENEEVEESDYSPSSPEQSQSQQEGFEENCKGDQDSKGFLCQNFEGKNSSTLIELKRSYLQTMQDSREKQNKDNPKKCVCNCKRTQCLKLYCDCFREGQSCGQDCQCNSCHNTQEYEEERQKIRQSLIKRNSQSFKAKIENNQHSKGCNCKKTFCLKKYCECYQAGLECGSNCKCQECQNGQTHKKQSYDKEDRFKNTVKKERRMREV